MRLRFLFSLSIFYFSYNIVFATIKTKLAAPLSSYTQAEESQSLYTKILSRKTMKYFCLYH